MLSLSLSLSVECYRDSRVRCFMSDYDSGRQSNVIVNSSAKLCCACGTHHG